MDATKCSNDYERFLNPNPNHVVSMTDSSLSPPQVNLTDHVEPTAGFPFPVTETVSSVRRGGGRKRTEEEVQSRKEARAFKRYWVKSTKALFDGFCSSLKQVGEQVVEGIRLVGKQVCEEIRQTGKMVEESIVNAMKQDSESLLLQLDERIREIVDDRMRMVRSGSSDSSPSLGA